MQILLQHSPYVLSLSLSLSLWKLLVSAYNDIYLSFSFMSQISFDPLNKYLTTLFLI